MVVVFHVAVLSSLQAGTATGIEGIPPLLVVLWYSIYACFRFGYHVTESYFSWFNGIVRKTVRVVEVQSIVLRRKGERIVAFNLVLRTRGIAVRNDFPQIEGLVRRLAKEHSIPLTEQQLL
jgi:hypothetical protein